MINMFYIIYIGNFYKLDLYATPLEGRIEN